VNERGYTLVEVAVAATILTVGVLAVAASGAPLARLIRWGGAQTRSAAVAAAQIEVLRSGCALSSDGETGGGGYRLRWAAASTGGLRTVTVVTTYAWAATDHSDVYETEIACGP
jgi:prepilin-type N-terminal cleavage/methylation domain-containing protein